jgi:hypothetical protein
LDFQRYANRFYRLDAIIPMTPVKLYRYFRSAASFRVRIARALKSLPRTMAAFEACTALPARQQAQPSASPDAQTR